jgi:Flp pilus assembly pilin Flp
MTTKRTILRHLSIGTLAGLTRMFAGHQQGATAVEYAIMASLIAGVIVGAVKALGTNVVTLFQSATNF